MPANIQKREVDLPALPDDLPRLTPQQFAFVVAYTSGQMSGVQALRTAYPKSNNWKPMTQSSETWKMLKNPQIAKWIATAQRTMLFGTSRSIEEHKRRLNALQHEALKAGNLGAAVKTEELIGRVEGHYVERVQIEQSQADIQVMTQTIEDVLGGDIAQVFADRMGYTEYRAKCKRVFDADQANRDQDRAREQAKQANG